MAATAWEAMVRGLLEGVHLNTLYAEQLKARGHNRGDGTPEGRWLERFDAFLGGQQSELTPAPLPRT